MTHRSYRSASRNDYGTSSDSALTIEQVKLGAILRIADATEAMAKRHTELIAERDALEERRNRLASRCAMLERQLAAQKGIATKLKKRLAMAQAQAFGDDPAAHKLPPREDEDGVRP